jgi:hypothetical protein
MNFDITIVPCQIIGLAIGYHAELGITITLPFLVINIRGRNNDNDSDQ